MINSPHVPNAGVLFAVMLKKMASAVSVDKKEQDRERFLPFQTEGGLVSPLSIITPPPSMQMSCK